VITERWGCGWIPHKDYNPRGKRIKGKSFLEKAEIAAMAFPITHYYLKRFIASFVEIKKENRGFERIRPPD